jgi:hypothetical protein
MESLLGTAPILVIRAIGVERDYPVRRRNSITKVAVVAAAIICCFIILCDVPTGMAE